jgi:ribosomal protein S4
MIHPSYQLNPGDMFQVEVEKVLLATGQQKPASSSGPMRRLRQAIAARRKLAKDYITQLAARQSAEPVENEESDGNETQSSKKRSALGPIHQLNFKDAWRVRQRLIRLLQSDVAKLVRRDKLGLDARYETALLRSYILDLLQMPAATPTGKLLSELETFVKTHYRKRHLFEVYAVEAGNTDPKAPVYTSVHKNPKPGSTASSHAPAEGVKLVSKSWSELSDEQRTFASSKLNPPLRLTALSRTALGDVMRKHQAAPVDTEKPYMTPWKPRPEMAAFSFIPRYLEVNPNICAAVYLRHPVARKGLGEVPTPFSYLTNQLTHNWYLRRR